MTEGARVSGRSRCDYMNDIRKGLDSDNLNKLNNSCFGPLLELDSMQAQGQLIYLMYKHIVPESLKRRRIAFSINSQELEFGPKEFCTITGLRFGQWSNPPKASRIHADTFGGKDVLFVKDIYDAFTRESASCNGHGEKVLKLGLLLMLYSCVLIRGRTSKRIEVQYMHLADDLDRFNQFPWGLVAYDFLVVAGHNSKTSIDTKLEAGENPCFDAYGFTFAIQVFAYEVYADIAVHCASRKGGPEHQFPRMLRWRADKFFRYEHVKPYFEESIFARSANPIINTVEENNLLEKLGVIDGMHTVPPEGMFRHLKVIPRGRTKKYKMKTTGQSIFAKRSSPLTTRDDMWRLENTRGCLTTNNDELQVPRWVESLHKKLSNINHKLNEVMMQQNNESTCQRVIAAIKEMGKHDTADRRFSGTEDQMMPKNNLDDSSSSLVCYDLIGNVKGDFVGEKISEKNMYAGTFDEENDLLLQESYHCQSPSQQIEFTEFLSQKPENNDNIVQKKASTIGGSEGSVLTRGSNNAVGVSRIRKFKEDERSKSLPWLHKVVKRK